MRSSSIISLLQKALCLLPEDSPESFTSTRRDFLKVTAGVIGSTLVAEGKSVIRPGTPKIITIGAGLSGLMASYTLSRKGIECPIYEAQNRIGGRVFTKYNYVAEGINTELGGEFIASDHTQVLALCKQFKLPLLDTQASSERKLISEDYFIDHKRFREQDILSALQPFVNRIRQDQRSIPTDLTKPNPALLKLDKLSIDEYLQNVGVSGWLFTLLTNAFTSEYGIASDKQSCLNMLILLGIDQHTFSMYGPSDERYKLAGGNSQLVEALARSLKSTINTGYRLEAVKELGKKYLLTFTNGQEVTADVIIMSLPFSVLREVKLQIPISTRKKMCIDQLGYGQQSKLILGFDGRPWREQGYNGYVLSDSIHNGWDSSQMQHNNVGVGSYTIFLGSGKGRELSSSKAPQYLEKLGEIYSGVTTAYNGHCGLMNWYKNPFSRGAYACYLTNQFSEFGGIESQPVGNMYFIGEHCSLTHQGFMEGAIRTGAIIANRLMEKYKIH